jgi:hypothetical protein
VQVQYDCVVNNFKSLVVYFRESSYKLVITCCRSAVIVLLHFGQVVSKQFIKKRKGIVQQIIVNA